MNVIFEQLKVIGETSSRNKKEELLKEMYKMFPEATKNILDAAYNPFRTFGISGKNKVYFTENPIVNNGLHQVFEKGGLLEQLETRTLTGNAAREAVKQLTLNFPIEDSLILDDIFNKDLRCGINISTINKALGKDFIPEFNTMLAHKYEPKRVSEWPVYVEPKLDGMRCVAKVQNGSVEFFSRNGMAITSIPHLEDAVKEMLFSVYGEPVQTTTYVDGELTSGDNFNISISALRKKDKVAQEAKFHVFEILTEDEFINGSQDPHKLRVMTLLALKARFNNKFIELIDVKTALNDEEVLNWYQHYRDQGVEGIIVKDPNGLYQPKRSHAWMKIKECNDVDLKVIGTFEGKGKYENQLGGIIVDHNGVEVRVGCGFSDYERIVIWGNPQMVMGLTAEIQYHEVTPDGSLRHPRFVKFREDK